MSGPPGTVVIIGLGLMGGSLARDLAGLGRPVVGVDRDPATREAALAAGAVTQAFDDAELDDALATAELVVLAVPVGGLPALLDRVATTAPVGAVVTDVGSTKRRAVAAAGTAGVAPRFVGAHPMAGDARSGWEAARAGLFAGATVWICAPDGAAPGAVARVEALWRDVGGIPRRIDAAAHDHLVARSSHTPQLVASALAVALQLAGVPRSGLGPGGRDMTRLAGSDPVVWTDILMDNRDEVGGALDDLIRSLTLVRGALAEGDPAAVGSLLGAARRWALD